MEFTRYLFFCLSFTYKYVVCFKILKDTVWEICLIDVP